MHSYSLDSDEMISNALLRAQFYTSDHRLHEAVLKFYFQTWLKPSGGEPLQDTWSVLIGG